MVRCIVDGCKWSRKTIPSDEVLPKMHRFPKEKERRDQWVTSLGKEIPEDPRICKEHFEDDQYEI